MSKKLIPVFLVCMLVVLPSACLRETKEIEEEPPSTPNVNPAEPIIEPDATQIPAFKPPAGYKQYQDSVAKISVYIPSNWIVTSIVDGQYAIFQSYSEDKYIGGEPFRPGDTKCDLFIHPSGTRIDNLLNQWKSGPNATVISEETITLNSGGIGIRLEMDSMGRSNSIFSEINENVIILVCFGELAIFDEIANSLTYDPK